VCVKTIMCKTIKRVLKLIVIVSAFVLLHLSSGVILLDFKVIAKKISFMTATHYRLV
jgi:hypothetical protein